MTFHDLRETILLLIVIVGIVVLCELWPAVIGP